MAENGALMFKKIKNGHETYETFQKIEAEKIFFIPGDATHTGIYNGQIAFFISAWPTSYKGKKWRFFNIPACRQASILSPSRQAVWGFFYCNCAIKTDKI